MDSKAIKRKVREFRKKFDLKTVDYKGIRNALEKSGYSLIEFNNVYNDKNVASLIDALNLTEYVRTTKCFTYADTNYRLIFVHEDLSESEKLLVLSHEAAHVALGHMSSRPIIGNAIREEYEANEFSHYLLNRSIGDKLYDHKKLIILFVAAALIAAAVLFALLGGDADSADNSDKKDTSVTETDIDDKETGDTVNSDTGEDPDSEAVEYYKNYYITPTGLKYHKEECKRIKDKMNKSRMTLDDYESGRYEPCDICLPEDE